MVSLNGHMIQKKIESFHSPPSNMTNLWTSVISNCIDMSTAQEKVCSQSASYFFPN